VSFTLEPHRLRVVWAKLVTVVILALATIVLAIIFGAIGTMLSAAITGNEAVWNIDAGPFAWTIFNQLAYFMMAFAFGLVFLSTPTSIAVYYVVALLLPFMVYGTLYAFFEWAQDVISVDRPRFRHDALHEPGSGHSRDLVHHADAGDRHRPHLGRAAVRARPAPGLQGRAQVAPTDWPPRGRGPGAPGPVIHGDDRTRYAHCLFIRVVGMSNQPAPARADGRNDDQLRPITITRHWLDHAAGSVLVSSAAPKVLCAASASEACRAGARARAWVG
jgi:hypothetical protein